jgi:hypothetical protein
MLVASVPKDKGGPADDLIPPSIVAELQADRRQQ